MLPAGIQVHFTPPQFDVPRQAAVEDASWLGDGAYEVAFAGVGDRATADALVGSHCLVLRRDVADLAGQAAGISLEGFAFVADGEDLGTVEALRDNPGQQLLEVRRREGGALLLVPFVDEFIDAIDHDGRTIEASLPAGLLEL